MTAFHKTQQKTSPTVDQYLGFSMWTYYSPLSLPLPITIFKSHRVLLCLSPVSLAPNPSKLSSASSSFKAWHPLRNFPFWVSCNDAKLDSSRNLLMYWHLNEKTTVGKREAVPLVIRYKVDLPTPICISFAYQISYFLFLFKDNFELPNHLFTAPPNLTLWPLTVREFLLPLLVSF